MTKRISELLELEEAYSEVLDQGRRRQVFIPDVINFLDSTRRRDEILQNLKEKINSGQYQARPLVRMDVPKDSFFIRPAGRPLLEDWIVYHAAAKYIGQNVDRKLGSNVFSHRFDPNTGRLLHWADQWLKFDKAFWADSDKGFKYVLKTDITSYFANISIDRLRDRIVALLNKSEEANTIIELLFNRLLRPWSEREVNRYFGLPQGTSASSILANLFLIHVDALFSRDRRFRYLRYADDIRILAKTEVHAKIALKELTNALRDIGLDLNEKKTQILHPGQAVQELRDPRRQDLDIIQTALTTQKERFIRIVALPLLQDLFERSFDPDNVFGGRHLRFCVNCFVRLREIYGVRDTWVSETGTKLMGGLQSMPRSANVFRRFWSVFPKDTFKKPLVEFLNSEANIYSWQEMWVLDCLLRFEVFSSQELEVFKEIAFDRDRHPLCRAKAILLMGKFGNEHERYELRRKFNEESDCLVKRAMIIATQELSVPERNAFYSSVKRTCPEQADLVDYVKSLADPLYFDEYLPSPVSIVEEEY